jgi:hypothetical protein
MEQKSSLLGIDSAKQFFQGVGLDDTGAFGASYLPPVTSL